MRNIFWLILLNVAFCSWCPSYAAEATGKTSAAVAGSASYFEARIAPILARHCLECHDTSSRKGRLDLSHRDSALAGGKTGKAIVPRRSAESLLWKQVESDEMPEDRPPLSPEEKKLLREWIDSGAVWSGETIDPLAHQRDPRAAQNRLRRLTVAEYIETVRTAVGVEIEDEARQFLPPDLRADGFSNTAYNMNVDLAHVEAYARLAQVIVSRMDAEKFARRFEKRQELSDEAARSLIRSMGKWILRGPLDDAEVAAFLSIAHDVKEAGGDFPDAVSWILEAMLQAPRFVYRIETQNQTGTPAVRGYELASRLSYSIWGGPPDAELMRAAEAGELARKEGIHAQVERMLKDPRAIEQSKRFMHEWLNLDRLANLRPDRQHFPKWDTLLAEDMRRETMMFFEEIAWKQDRPLWELLNARVTFATPRLAAHYGLKRDNRPAGGKSGLLALYTFGEGKGNTVRDTSAVGEAMNLKIERAGAVRWEDGGLMTDAITLIATAKPATDLIDAVKRSNALSVELWFTPVDARQEGPARILTLSADSSKRNFTIGQEGDQYEIRLRSTRTDANGQPALRTPPGTVRPGPTHLVYTRDSSGRAVIYLDGEPVMEGKVGGDFSNWDEGFRLGIANELTKDRRWRGTFHRVAIYDRALSPGEIRSHGKGLSRYDLTDDPSRGGLLTQGSVLTIGGDEASMVARGLFVLKDLLYSGVGSPPPGVDTTPKPTRPGQSQRVMAEERLANSSCVGCHAKIEPLAFGLEKFDGIGGWREKDRHGNILREDGEIVLPGEHEPLSYKTSAELMDLLAGSERVRKNFARKLAQFAIGRPLVESDASAIDEVYAEMKKSGGTYRSLIKAIVMSDLIQNPSTEKAR